MEKYKDFISNWITTLHLILTIGLTTGLIFSTQIGNTIIMYAFYVLTISCWVWIIFKCRKIISDLIQDKAHWQYAATYDSLTNVLNRGIFLQNVAKEVQRSHRYGAPMSFAMFDIDDFKSINDEYGHDVGDEALVKMSSIIKDAVRDVDEIGRIGGEEFGLLLPETGIDQAFSTCERIRKIVASMAINDGAFMTISIGVTEIKEGDSLDKIYKRADKALYLSKNGGRNKVSTL